MASDESSTSIDDAESVSTRKDEVIILEKPDLCNRIIITAPSAAADAEPR